MEKEGDGGWVGDKDGGERGQTGKCSVLTS